MVKLMPGTKDASHVTIPQRVHLVGAGGMHLSAIGQVLLRRGHTVTGSDLAMTEYTERLRTLGAAIYEGHAAANLGAAELVVATVAAGANNPELEAARERGIPIIVRAEMVQRLIADRDVLAVAGSHGKTTTTSFAALMAIRSELDPLVLSGGDSRELGGNARDGAGALAVIEADEYAEAFLEYEPAIAVITNVEPDHLDYYGTEARLIAAFSAFTKRVRPDGLLIVCVDSPRAAAIAEARIADGMRVERYALDHEAEWRAAQLRPNDHGGLDFLVRWDGEELGRVSLRVPGRHNVANALGAIAASMRAGADFNRAALAASEFTGADRRFQLVAEVDGITLMDDYAHHPTEVRATLNAARQRFAGRRIVGCFQPHTYSRSQYLLEEFRTCFERLDALYVVDTYAARERPDAGIDAQALAREIERPPAQYLGGLDEAAEPLAEALQPGDVLFTIGAGDVFELGPRVRDLIEARPPSKNSGGAS